MDGGSPKVKVHFQRLQALLRVADSKSASWRAVCDILISKQTLKKKNYSRLIVLGYGEQFFLITLEFSSLTTFGDVWRSCTALKLNGDSFVAKSCPNSRDPMDCRPSGSSVPGIIQAGILEWVAICFSRRWSRPRNRTRVSGIVGRFFTNCATREAPKLNEHLKNTSLSSYHRRSNIWEF